MKRTRLNPVSAKRAARDPRARFSTFGTPRQGMKHGKKVNPVNRARKAKNTLRAYGPAARREFVASLPCAVCQPMQLKIALVNNGYRELLACDSLEERRENAHTRTGGMGRKADYRLIVPLCAPHWTPPDFRYNGCHRVLHDLGADHPTFALVDFPAEARATEQQWQNFLAASR